MPEIQAMSLEKQQDHLQKVSRTFALTIPLLPPDLRDYVGNAYLLCRIADTLEDDPKADAVQKIVWLKDFAFLAFNGFQNEALLISLRDKALLLVKDGAKEAEYALLEDMIEVINRTLSFPRMQIDILSRGVGVLASGMADKIAETKINSEDDVDDYCYMVAGVVGELLASLFFNITVKSSSPRMEVMAKAVSFGEGLQLTNILKDRYEDSTRNVSFLPRVAEDKRKDEIDFYIKKTMGHLDDALDFVLSVPAKEKGIRLFCYFNVAMAIMTLKKIAKNPFGKSSDLKISRSDVKRLAALCRFAVGSDFLLNMLHRHLSCRMQRQRQDVKKLYAKVSRWHTL